MAERWDGLARRDAMHFIATSRTAWDADGFYASGQRLVDRIMSWVGDRAARRRMLEIGCGLGRTAVHFARLFERVDGIDISPAMIEQARQHQLPANLNLAVSSGEDLALFADRSFDLVYSGLVFQHIADDVVIQTYLSEIARVLDSQGVAVLHMDTRPQSLARRVYLSFPDFLLPRHHRHYIRRYRRDARQLRQWMHNARLDVYQERNPATADHFFFLRHARVDHASTGAKS